MTRLLAALAAAFIAVTPTGAQAQDTASARPAVPPESFREGYEPARLSSPVIVGAALGSPAANATGGSAFTVHNPFSGTGGFCVQAVSQDGLFWARNPYEGAPEAASWTIERLSERFGSELRRYRADQVFVLAGKPGDHDALCESEPDLVTPLVHSASGALMVAINSQNRLSEAELTDPSGRIIASARCDRLEGPAIVADRVCVLEPDQPWEAGTHRLSILFDDAPFGVQEWSTHVALPAGYPD